MRIIEVDNVNQALWVGVNDLLVFGAREESRAGDVLVLPHPVITVYASPWRRVLFSAVRDANPAFHLAEALWMLAGRSDAKFLDVFVKDFSARFAEADGRIHGAYGHRWRNAFGLDQLEIIIDKLKNNPKDRQAVLQMWDSHVHTRIGMDDLFGDFKDRPCNTTVYFRIQPYVCVPKLDIGVCCRSNDIIMGCLAGDTIIMSPEGNLPISSLARHFSLGLKRYPVYAVDPKTGDMALKWCVNAWRTGRKPVRELVFDDGTSLRLTADHKLYLKKTQRGKFNSPSCIVEVEAGQLKVGDRIWAPAPSGEGYLRFKRNVLNNTAWKNMQSVHGAYDELLYGLLPRGWDVHHKDEDTLNNTAKNLVRLSDSAHMGLHARNRMKALGEEGRRREGKRLSVASAEAYSRLSSRKRKELDARRTAHCSDSMTEYWKGVSAEERSARATKASLAARKVVSIEELRQRGAKGSRSRWSDPEQRRRQSELMKRLNVERRLRANHKIVAINELPPESVYDFTVEDFHTALVGNGVLAHNCYGANAVHFSVLQEYLAARIGILPGTYYQFSWNYHAYLKDLATLATRAGWKADPTRPWGREWVKQLEDDRYTHGMCKLSATSFPPGTPYKVEHQQMFDHPDHADEDIRQVLAMVEERDFTTAARGAIKNFFLRNTAVPLFEAHLKRDHLAANTISADDWKVAEQEWLERRRTKDAS